MDSVVGWVGSLCFVCYSFYHLAFVRLGWKGDSEKASFDLFIRGSCVALLCDLTLPLTVEIFLSLSPLPPPLSFFFNLSE